MSGNISVPKAGTTAGRSADLASRMHTPQTGNILAGLGDTMLQVGMRLENERAERELQRAQVDYTRDLNDLRLEAMQIGDPDQLETFWSQKVTTLRETYSGKISERNRERFSLGFDATANSLAFGVGKDALAARVSQREANWLAFEHELVRGAANADADTRATFIAQGEAAIDAQVASGDITAEDGQRRKLGLAASADNAAALQAIAVDPAAFLEDINAGGYANLDGEALARYRVSAETALAKMAEAELTAADQAQKAREKNLDARITDAVGVIASGRTYIDQGLLDDPEAKARPGYARLAAAAELDREKPGLARMTLADLDAVIAEEEAKAIPSKEFGARLDYLRETRERLAKGYTTDAVATMREAGLPVPELPDFDPANPAAYAQGLRARAAMAEKAIADGRINVPVIFDALERAALEAQMGAKGDPDTRAAWLATMTRELGPDAGQFVRAATGDATTGFAADLLARGGDPRTARDMLAGQRRVIDKTIVLPPRNDFVAAFGVSTAEELRDQFGFAAPAIDAAMYLYAEAGGDPEDIDGDLFGRSVQRAMGATPGPRGDYDVGGLQRFGGRRNGYFVDLPAGVAKPDVERALGTVADLFNRTELAERGLNAMGAPERGAMDVLTAISTSGAAPDIGAATEDESLTERFQGYELDALWLDGQPTGYYTFSRRRDNGRRDPLYTEAGALYRFRLEDLIREAR